MGFHVAGVREPRLARGVFVAVQVRVRSSGRDNYDIGCSRLVRGHLPRRDKGGKRRATQPKLLNILAQTPRLLVVGLKAPGLRATMAVARAPRSRASDDACATYRGQLSARAMKRRIDLMLIDANAAAGQRASDGGGDCGDPRDENRGGFHFHGYLKERDLAAVSALCDATGPSYAYLGNCRVDGVDYVVVPVRDMPAATLSQVVVCVDVRREDEGHLPVTCAMKFKELAHVKTAQPPRDQRQLRSRRRRQIFRGRLASVPLLARQAELNDRACVANMQVNAIAGNVFKRGPVRPRKSCMADATFALVRLRRAV